MIPEDDLRALNSELLVQGAHLTGSPEDAEDLLQEAWVRWFERDAVYLGFRQAKGWLSITMRTLARAEYRKAAAQAL